MTVGELKKMLEQYPDGMEVMHNMHSDYEAIEDCSIVKAVHNNSGWWMRSHSTMSEENKRKEKDCLHLFGI